MDRSPDKRRPISEVFERYALGLARDQTLPEGTRAIEYRQTLIDTLIARGVRGWPERGTFFTRTLPTGCGPCLQGQGSNLCLTTLCTRECFFCFNPKPREDLMSVHGKNVSDIDEIPNLLEELGVRSLGLSGGEPLLKPERVLNVIKSLRSRFGRDLRIDLYTNGDLLTDDLLHTLLAAGLDGIRINLAAVGYKIDAVKLALKQMKEIAVEIPAIPQHRERLKRLVVELDEIEAPHLIVHELFASAQNIESLSQRGYRSAGQEDFDKLTWRGVLESDAVALEVLLHAQEIAKVLSVYYCSCATQQWIGEQALARRVFPQ